MARITDARLVAAIPFRIRRGEREYTVIVLSEDGRPPNDADMHDMWGELIKVHEPLPVADLPPPADEQAPAAEITADGQG